MNKLSNQQIGYLLIVHATQRTDQCHLCIDLRKRGLMKRGYGSWLHKALMPYRKASGI